MQEYSVDFVTGNTTINSISDLNLVYKSFSLTAPEAQTAYITVPFHDGPLDATEYFGRVKYNYRELKMGFYVPLYGDHTSIYSNVLNKLNGKKFQITTAKDENWYYDGRISAGDLTHDGNFWGFELSAIVQPYKRKKTLTTYTNTGGGTLTCVNSYMPLNPTITVSAETTIVFGESTVTLSAGTHVVSDFLFTEGNNVLTITSDGTTEVSYREGSL